MNALFHASVRDLWLLAGWTMVHFLWLGTIVAIAAFVFRALLRHASANVRYIAALTSLLALAVLPMATAAWLMKFAPPQTLISSAPANASHEVTQNVFPLATAASSQNTATVAPSVAPGSAGGSLASPLQTTDASASALENPRQTRGLPDGALATTPTKVAELLDRFIPYLPWVWLLGTPLTFLLLVSGVVGTRRLSRCSRVIENDPIVDLLAHLAASLRISQQVTIAVCDRIASPVLIGIIRPMILLPPAALTGWSPDEIEMVLLHELAHVQRWDNLINLLQRCVESLLFFHPAVWFISGWARQEREACCDAAVVSRTNQPHAYAELLVALAAQLPRSVLFHPAASSAMAAGPLRSRIRHILKMEDDPMLISGKSLALMLGSMLVAATLIVLYVPSIGHADPTSKDDSSDDSKSQEVEFPYEVKYEKGASKFLAGDEIVIDEIRGTAEHFEPGNKYRIKGKYKLSSHSNAQLLASITSHGGKVYVAPPHNSQPQNISQGDGEFTFILPMPYPGSPHVSFYSSGGGKGFGGVYFGTGDSVLKKWWDAENSTNKQTEELTSEITLLFRQQSELDAKLREDSSDAETLAKMRKVNADIEVKMQVLQDKIKAQNGKEAANQLIRKIGIDPTKPAPSDSERLVKLFSVSEKNPTTSAGYRVSSQQRITIEAIFDAFKNGPLGNQIHFENQWDDHESWIVVTAPRLALSGFFEPIIDAVRSSAATPANSSSKFPSLEEQKLADVAFRRLGVELERIGGVDLERVKALGYDGGVKIVARTVGFGSDTLKPDDIIVGLGVWPTTNLKEVVEVFTRPEIGELNPMIKFYVVRPKELPPPGSKASEYHDYIQTGRVDIREKQPSQETYSAPPKSQSNSQYDEAPRVSEVPRTIVGGMPPVIIQDGRPSQQPQVTVSADPYAAPAAAPVPVVTAVPGEVAVDAKAATAPRTPFADATPTPVEAPAPEIASTSADQRAVAESAKRLEDAMKHKLEVTEKRSQAKDAAATEKAKRELEAADKQLEEAKRQLEEAKRQHAESNSPPPINPAVGQEYHYRTLPDGKVVIETHPAGQPRLSSPTIAPSPASEGDMTQAVRKAFTYSADQLEAAMKRKSDAMDNRLQAKGPEAIEKAKKDLEAANKQVEEAKRQFEEAKRQQEMLDTSKSKAQARSVNSAELLYDGTSQPILQMPTPTRPQRGAGWVTEEQSLANTAGPQAASPRSASPEEIEILRDRVKSIEDQLTYTTERMKAGRGATEINVKRVACDLAVAQSELASAEGHSDEAIKKLIEAREQAEIALKIQTDSARNGVGSPDLDGLVKANRELSEIKLKLIRLQHQGRGTKSSDDHFFEAAHPQSEQPSQSASDGKSSNDPATPVEDNVTPEQVLNAPIASPQDETSPAKADSSRIVPAQSHPYEVNNAKVFPIATSSSILGSALPSPPQPLVPQSTTPANTLLAPALQSSVAREVPVRSGLDITAPDGTVTPTAITQRTAPDGRPVFETITAPGPVTVSLSPTQAVDTKLQTTSAKPDLRYDGKTFREWNAAWLSGSHDPAFNLATLDALEAFAEAGGYPEANRQIEHGLFNENEGIQWRTRGYLHTLSKTDAEPIVSDLLHVLNTDLSPDRRICAIRGIASIGPNAESALPALKEILAKKKSYDRIATAAAIKMIVGKDQYLKPIADVLGAELKITAVKTPEGKWSDSPRGEGTTTDAFDDFTNKVDREQEIVYSADAVNESN